MKNSISFLLLVCLVTVLTPQCSAQRFWPFPYRSENLLRWNNYDGWINFWLEKKRPLSDKKTTRLKTESVQAVGLIMSSWNNHTLSYSDRKDLVKEISYVYERFSHIEPSILSRVKFTDDWEAFQKEAIASDCTFYTIDGWRLFNQKKYAESVEYAVRCKLTDPLSNHRRGYLLSTVFKEMTSILSEKMLKSTTTKKSEAVIEFMKVMETPGLNLLEVDMPEEFAPSFNNWNSFITAQRDQVFDETERNAKRYVEDQDYLSARKEYDIAVKLAQEWGIDYVNTQSEKRQNLIQQAKVFYRNRIGKFIDEHHFNVARREARRLCEVAIDLSLDKELEEIRYHELNVECARRLKEYDQTKRLGNTQVALTQAEWLRDSCNAVRLNGLDIVREIIYLKEKLGYQHYAEAVELYDEGLCMEALFELKIAKSYFSNTRKFEAEEKNYITCATKTIAVFVCKKNGDYGYFSSGLYVDAKEQIIDELKEKLSEQTYASFTEVISPAYSLSSSTSSLLQTAKGAGAHYAIIVSIEKGLHTSYVDHLPDITWACQSVKRSYIDECGRLVTYREYTKNVPIQTYKDQASARAEVTINIYDLRKSYPIETDDKTVSDRWEQTTKNTPSNVDFSTIRHCPSCLVTFEQTSFFSSKDYNTTRSSPPSSSSLINWEVLKAMKLGAKNSASILNKNMGPSNLENKDRIRIFETR